MNLRTLRQFASGGKNLKGKKVLVRVGFDCPIKNGKVIDDSRIRQVLPTINYLIKKKTKIILISHLGRPLEHENIKTLKHKNKEIKKKFSLLPVYNYLKKMNLPIRFVDDCIGPKVKKIIQQMKPEEVILLENLRFYPGEEKNDLKFAKKLANSGDIYINDAFSVCHRSHASVSAITKYLPSYAGFCLEEEIKILSEVLKKPRHPLIVIMGGKKIETKIKPIKNLLKKADKVLIAGALASNFLKAAGDEIGKSIYEPKMITTAKKLLQNKKIVLPMDVRIKFKNQNSKCKITIQNSKIEDLKTINNQQFEILDIGPGTIETFEKYLKSAKMVFWNGPMGYFEDKNFSQGTKSIAETVLNNRRAQIVIGGGETIASLKFKNQSASRRTKIKNNVFISTGGGAMLEFLEGKILPGIRPLIKS